MAATPAHPDLANEQAFLTRASQCLSAMKKDVERRRDGGADPKASAAIKAMHDRMLERLTDPESICFGRLNLDAGDRLYIGRQAILDRGDPIVINWAALAAAPFFEASVERPYGVTLRRRFRTKGNTLLSIADEILGDGGTAEPQINDILLEELGRERTAEMREVAATIQRDQYAIVTRPLDTVTIVQGGPGTGKTVVGLHRAALLLFRHREEITRSRVLIIGPNRLFMRYIQYVLPSLGETAAEQYAIDALGQVPVGDDDEPFVARLKGDPRMATIMRRAVVDRVRPPAEDLDITVENVPVRLSTGAVGGLVDDGDLRSLPYLVGRERFRNRLERAIRGAFTATMEGRGRSGASPAGAIRTLPEFERAMDRIWPTITAPELLRQLLSSEDRLERAAAGLLTEMERRVLYRKPVERLEQVSWSPSDIPLVDEIQTLLEPDPVTYGHVVLDEAQDLTPMQLRMVGRRVRGHSITILGDLAQATGLWRYDSWDEIGAALGLDTPIEPIELTLAYRVPQEIMALALPVLELTAPSISPPQAIRKVGLDPSFEMVAGSGRAAAAVQRAVEAKAEGGTVGIIGPAAALSEVAAELRANRIEFGDIETDTLSDSVELLDPISAKGLEFDHVVLLEPAAIVREGGEDQRYQALYVALTRAMRTLSCVHSEPLPFPFTRPVSAGDEHPSDSSPPVPTPVDKPSAANDRAGSSGDPSAEAGESLVAHLDKDAGTSPGRINVTAADGTPTLSISEALLVVQSRGRTREGALARGLLACVRGATEAGIAAAILADETAAGGNARRLLDFAQELVGPDIRDPDEPAD